MNRLDITKIYKDYSSLLKTKEGKEVFLNSIGSEIYDCYKGSKSFIDMMSKIWDENIHFYEGDQYIYYNDMSGQYEVRPITKYNRYIPRTVTNYIYPTTETITSIFTKNKVTSKVLPNSTSNEDINKAKVADIALDAKNEIDDEQTNDLLAAKLAILTGTVYAKDFWDTSTIETVNVGKETKKIPYRAIEAGIKEESKEHGELGEDLVKQIVLDHLKEDINYYGDFSKKDKKKIKDNEEDEEELELDDRDFEYEEEIELPLGDTSVRILSVFEIIPDILKSIKNIDEGDYIFEATLHSLEYIKDTYNKKLPGYTGFAKDVKEDAGLSLQLTYFERLKGSTGRSGQYGVIPDLKNQAVLIECYIRPTVEYPKGLMVVVSNGKVLYINPSHYTYANGKNWNPYTMWRWNLHPLRHYGVSLTEQQVPIQKQINSINNLKVLNRMTMANPVWMIPNGCLTPGGYITGEPGLNVPFNPAVGTPIRMDGKGLDSSVYKEEADKKQDFHIISGDNEVLQGIRPTGVDTASQMNMLLEQSYSKFSPQLQSWESFKEERYTKKLNLMRRFYKEPRPEFIKRMKAMNKDLTTVQISDFLTGKDFGDNIQVRVEAGSSMPRSSAVHQSNLKELIPLGVFGQLDPNINPEGNRQLLEEFGLTDFYTPTGADTKRSLWENDLMRQKKFSEVDVLPFDNPVIHYQVVTTEMKRPEFWQNMPEDVIAQFSIHALKHYLDMTPEQVKMAGISVTQEQKLVGMGMKLINLMDDVQKKQLEEKAILFMPKPQFSPMIPQAQNMGVTAEPNSVANVSPAGATAGQQGGSSVPTSPGVA